MDLIYQENDLLLYNNTKRISPMKEITLKVPDKKLNFFMELVKQLGFEVTQDDLVIPEEHKEIVRKRIKNAKQEDFIPWEEARKQLKFKTK
jgi:hypothetical protein